VEFKFVFYPSSGGLADLAFGSLLGIGLGFGD
jgi:hypothetical protein